MVLLLKVTALAGRFSESLRHAPAVSVPEMTDKGEHGGAQRGSSLQTPSCAEGSELPQGDSNLPGAAQGHQGGIDSKPN